MGPFVPDIISDELSLVFGFLIGIAFGFVLEQAGFSSSRKLTGLFYGRDFTVLRVFFTAAITAMSGVLLLASMGFLDTSIIYVNPTYLRSAIIGGAIMGVGFVVGGYCPGTSVCGAAIGKVDAMVFVVGGVIGVLLFGEGFPLYDAFYTADFLGDVTVPDSLGISSGLFGLLLICAAVGAFMLTTRIEQRVNPSAISKTFPVGRHRAAGLAALALGVVLALLPTYRDSLLSRVADEGIGNSTAAPSITSDELAFRILDKDPWLQIIDTRDSMSFARITLPGAVHIPIDEMFGKQWRDILNQDRLKKVFFAENDSLGRQAAALALTMGYKNVRFLRGGMEEFGSTILRAPTPAGELTPEQRDAARFRTKASAQIAILIKEHAAGGKKTPRPVKKITGGCGA